VATFAGADRITAIELKLMLIENYLIAIQVKLLTSRVVHSFTILKARCRDSGVVTLQDIARDINPLGQILVPLWAGNRSLLNCPKP